jgi:hypothetical protein
VSAIALSDELSFRGNNFFSTLFFAFHVVWMIGISNRDDGEGENVFVAHRDTHIFADSTGHFLVLPGSGGACPGR